MKVTAPLQLYASDFQNLIPSSLPDHPQDEEEDEQPEEEEDEDGLRFSNAGSYSCSGATTFILQGFGHLYRLTKP